MSFLFNEVSTNTVTTQSVILSGNSGSDGDVIANVSGNTLWSKMNGLVSLYTDSTDNVQDIAVSPPINISFNKEEFNFANIEFSSNDTFRFSNAGIYRILFQCLLSDSSAQSMVSFYINGAQLYGNMSVTGNSTFVPYILEYDFIARPGDVLNIVGEKYNGGPNYLKNNPIYSNSTTMLSIVKL
jgi:hypothetical protein